MSDNLHPYDDVERRFRDDDDDPSRRARGRDLVARLLGGTAVPAAGLRYDFSFYSGGIGVIDRLYVALPCGAAEVDAIVARLGWLTPEASVADASWREHFLWLLGVEDEERPLRALVGEFIAEQRTDFQPVPDEQARVWFESYSGVNSWALLYEQDGRLCLIGYDQG